jgi:hypothetical protein
LETLCKFAFPPDLDFYLTWLNEDKRPMSYPESERRGMLQVIRNALLVKCQSEEDTETLLRKVQALDDGEKYLAIHETILKAKTLDQVRCACGEPAAPASKRKKSGDGKHG